MIKNLSDKMLRNILKRTIYFLLNLLREMIFDIKTEKSSQTSKNRTNSVFNS